MAAIVVKLGRGAYTDAKEPFVRRALQLALGA
jgi:hypothetical protein